MFDHVSVIPFGVRIAITFFSHREYLSHSNLHNDTSPAVVLSQALALALDVKGCFLQDGAWHYWIYDLRFLPLDRSYDSRWI